MLIKTLVTYIATLTLISSGVVIPAQAYAATSPVTTIATQQRSGQTFLTWGEDPVNVGEKYNVYRLASPITSANLNQANLLTAKWGPLNDDTSRNYLTGEGSPDNFIVTDLGSPLSDNTGLFVHTSSVTEFGIAYYAVTTVVGGVENRTITPGRNATTAPINEVHRITGLDVYTLTIWTMLTGIPLGKAMLTITQLVFL